MKCADGYVNSGGYPMRLIAALVAVVVSPALTARAAPTPAKEERSERLSGLLGLSFQGLMDVDVAVASRTSEQVRNTPSSVTIFLRDEIKRMGARSVEELLNHVPGFQVSRDTLTGNHQGVSARGSFGEQAARDILIMIDGHRLNEYFTGGALLFNSYLSVDNIKQIEVIRGPGSAL